MQMYFGSGYLLYLVISLPALLLGLWAQFKVQSTFKKYSQVRTYVGLTGSQVARRILDANGLQNIRIEETNGFLSDHYDPSAQVLRLSPDVYRSNSISASGVAAHESGHALQHQQGYALLKLRTTIVPTVQIGSWLGPIIFFVGLYLSTTIAWVGLALFAATAAFALITLPVELDASNRAKQWLPSAGVANQTELDGATKVLNAAAWTYVAAAIQAVTTVLYYAFLLLGRRRN
jgi:uncharacterized protein